MENIIKEYIDQSTWKIKENANFGFSLSGLKCILARFRMLSCARPIASNNRRSGFLGLTNSKTACR